MSLLSPLVKFHTSVGRDKTLKESFVIQESEVQTLSPVEGHHNLPQFVYEIRYICKVFQIVRV